MDSIQLKIIGPVMLGGKRPGETFAVPAQDGLPIDLYWRRRLQDEVDFKCGAVEVVKPMPPVVEDTPPADEPVADAKAPTAKKKA